MRFSAIIAAAAAAGVLLVLGGCADNGGGSSSGSTSQSQHQQSYQTSDELFSLSLNERFSQFEGVYPADFDFLFMDTEKNVTAGIMEMSGLHTTPEFYCEYIKNHYEELYGTVKSSEAEANGLPAYLLEAEFTDEDGSELVFYHKAVGFGNGDLLVVISTAPQSAPDEAAKAVDDIMAGITYNGEPAKSGSELHENEFFSITADKDWYYYSKDDSEATLRPNIASTSAERFGSFKISAEKLEKSAQELSGAEADEFDANEKITDVSVSETSILGRDAVCVSCILRSDYIDLRRDIFYFDNNGAVYKVQFLAPEDSIDEFRSVVQPVIDTIEIK